MSEKPSKGGGWVLAAIVVAFLAGRCSNEPPTPTGEPQAIASIPDGPSGASSDAPSATDASNETPTTTTVEAEEPDAQPDASSALAAAETALAAARATTQASGDGYINSDGDHIASPTFAPSAPPGASAQCRDGSYSFSASRRGTCSHHGGVADWL